MHRTGWLPLLLSAAVYAVLSAAHPIAAVDGAMLGELAQAFDLSLWTVLPALLILVLPLCRVPVRWSMAASVAAAFLVTVAQQRMPALQALRAALLGYAGPEGALREILSGGGVISMFTASVLAIATGLYAGLLSGIGALDGHPRDGGARGAPRGTVSDVRGRLPAVRDDVLQPVDRAGRRAAADGAQL